jgi:hypothetical protein
MLTMQGKARLGLRLSPKLKGMSAECRIVNVGSLVDLPLVTI